MWACGSPSKCGRCRRSFIWEGWPALAEIRETGQGFHFGAGVTHARAEAAMAAIDPDLAEMFRRFGGKQVRAVGTLGGNIANGSPIGDSMPALIALGTDAAPAPGRGDAVDAARGLLHRLRQAGPGGGRVRDRDRRPCRASGQARSSAATRSPSASTRTSPHSWAPSGSPWRGAAWSMRVSPSAAWRPRRSGPPPPKPPSRACRLRMRKAGTAPARLWRRISSPSTTCGPARATGWRRAQALLRKALHEAGGEASAATRLVGLRPGEAERAA